MAYLDAATASLAARDLSARLSAAGRARIADDDILDHLEAWEPDSLPATVRFHGASFDILTSSDVSPSTRRLLSAYATHGLSFHVLECADTE